MKLFLSYPIQDEKIARVIAEELTKAGFDVWAFFLSVARDASQPFGTSQDRVQEGIESADILLVLLSASTKRSVGVNREIVYAQHRDIPILPIKVEDADPPLSLLGYDALDIRGTSFINGAKQLVQHLKDNWHSTSSKRITVSETEMIEDRKRILEKDKLTRIFIAYSRLQRPLAQSVSDLLIRNGKAVFWDAKIKAGATWRQTIQKALDDATHLVVIWTPEAAESDEVEREVSYALAERKVIVPILSKEIPKLPYHLHGLHYIVLEEDVSKIEADLLKAIAQFSDGEDIWQ